MGLKEKIVVFVLSNSCLTGDQQALFYALGAFLRHGRDGLCHIEDALEVGRQKNINIQKIQVRNVTCPESQGMLVANEGAGLSLESAHTKTVFGL